MKKIFVAAATVAALAGSAAFAQDPAAMAMKARQGQFNILAINLGILGGMARGATPYDAEAAQAAADTIVAVSMINQAPLWPEGTDTMSVENTRALPAIWENLPDVMDKWAGLGAAAAKLQTVAGTGQEALGAAVGEVGGACKACHDTYRQPE